MILKHPMCGSVQMGWQGHERVSTSIFYTLCGGRIRSSKCQRAKVSFTHIRRGSRKRKNECWILLGCEVLTRKRPPTHSFGSLSPQLYAAPLFLCIRKCTEREGEERVRQALWEGEENLKWNFRMQAVGWLVQCEWRRGDGGKWNKSVFMQQRRWRKSKENTSDDRRSANF